MVHQPGRGYGNAYLKGFAHASGKYFIMGDADDTYDFTLIPEFLKKLNDEGYEFVTGSRYLSRDSYRSIPFLHRFLGNPLFTAILNGMFGTSYTNVYSGFRGFSRESYELIKPVSPGMEFDLELAINAGLTHLKVAGIPICLQPRKGISKISTFRDGWRSLRMMLIYCPNKVFILPGFFLLFNGMISHILLLAGLFRHADQMIDYMMGIGAIIFSVIGFQILNLGLHAKSYSWSRRFEKNPPMETFFTFFTLETGLITGVLLILIGIVIIILAILHQKSLLSLPFSSPGWMSLAATITIFGFSIVFTSLFISAMSMKKDEEKRSE